MKRRIKITTIITSIALSLFTGCGGGNNSNTTVTTIPCPNNPHTINNGRTWQYSQTDTRACHLLAPTRRASCTSNQVVARMDHNYNYGESYSYNQQYNGVNPNYHTFPNNYGEVCIDQGDRNLGYLVWTGSYYYIDQQRFHDNVWTYQHRYQQRQLTYKEALVTGVVTGTITGALWWLNSRY